MLLHAQVGISSVASQPGAVLPALGSYFWRNVTVFLPAQEYLCQLGNSRVRLERGITFG